MRLRSEKRRVTGLTRLEVVVVVVATGVLLFILVAVLSAWRAAGNMAKGIMCINNLKNVGLAFRVFATDHDSRFPWQVPANEGGSADSAQRPELLWRHFLVMTNAYMRSYNHDSPKYLWCPKDSDKRPAEVFQLTSANRNAVVFAGNQHLSYFLGLGANTNDWGGDSADGVLSGDRNLMVNGKAVGPGSVGLSGGQSLGFNPKQLHGKWGHLLLADGSVQEAWSNRVVQATSATNLLLVP